MHEVRSTSPPLSDRAGRVPAAPIRRLAPLSDSAPRAPIRSSEIANAISAPSAAASASAPINPSSSRAVNARITGAGGRAAWSTRASSITTPTAAALSTAPGLVATLS